MPDNLPSLIDPSRLSLEPSLDAALVEPIKMAMSLPMALVNPPPPEVVAMIPAARQAIERSLARAPVSAVETMMVKLGVLFPDAKLGDDSILERVNLYIELLGDLPADALAEGFTHAAKTCKFFPSVAEIRRGAWPIVARRQAQLHALRVLEIKHRDYRPPVPPEERPTPEDIDRILKSVGHRVGSGRDAE